MLWCAGAVLLPSRRLTPSRYLGKRLDGPRLVTAVFFSNFKENKEGGRCGGDVCVLPVWPD